MQQLTTNAPTVAFLYGPWRSGPAGCRAVPPSL